MLLVVIIMDLSQNPHASFVETLIITIFCIVKSFLNIYLMVIIRKFFPTQYAKFVSALEPNNHVVMGVINSIRQHYVLPVASISLCAQTVLSMSLPCNISKKTMMPNQAGLIFTF